jgi:hypothetical protein
VVSSTSDTVVRGRLEALVVRVVRVLVAMLAAAVAAVPAMVVVITVVTAAGTPASTASTAASGQEAGVERVELGDSILGHVDGDGLVLRGSHGCGVHGELLSVAYVYK